MSRKQKTENHLEIVREIVHRDDYL